MHLNGVTGEKESIIAVSAMLAQESVDISLIAFYGKLSWEVEAESRKQSPFIFSHL